MASSAKVYGVIREDLPRYKTPAFDGALREPGRLRADAQCQALSDCAEKGGARTRRRRRATQSPAAELTELHVAGRGGDAEDGVGGV